MQWILRLFRALCLLSINQSIQSLSLLAHYTHTSHIMHISRASSACPNPVDKLAKGRDFQADRKFQDPVRESLA